jgi:hypothetical protein
MKRQDSGRKQQEDLGCIERIADQEQEYYRRFKSTEGKTQEDEQRVVTVRESARQLERGAFLLLSLSHIH